MGDKCLNCKYCGHKPNRQNKQIRIIHLDQSKNNYFLLCDTRLDIIDTEFSTIFYFPWSVADYTDLINGKIIFNSKIKSTTYLEIQILDYVNNIILGSSGIITKSGLHTFPLKNPTSDTSLNVQVRATDNIGKYPQILGMVLKYM